MQGLKVAGEMVVSDNCKSQKDGGYEKSRPHGSVCLSFPLTFRPILRALTSSSHLGIKLLSLMKSQELTIQDNFHIFPV